MTGGGQVFRTVAPDGTALPCHSARMLPIECPNVREQSIEQIWNRANGFNHFRGYEWMKEPCASCDEKEKDFGGCRCQAVMMTGDANNADPVCSKSPHHDLIIKAREEAELPSHTEPVYRHERNSKVVCKGGYGCLILPTA